MPMKRDVAIKRLNFSITRRDIYVPLAISTRIYKKEKKEKKKTTTGRMLGQDWPDKHSAKCFIRSGEITSPRQTSIDKTNSCAMKFERGALVRGSGPPSRHTVHTTAGDV